jgi:bacillopeptidase F
MKTYHSRLEKVEEQGNYKNGAKYLVGSIFVVLFMIIFGIPLATRLAQVITNIKGVNTTAEKNDNTAPPAPRFKTIPEYTNKQTLTVEGASEPGAKIEVTVNSTKNQTLADENGNFTVNIGLSDGSNTISAKAIDQDSNESPVSEKVTTILDTMSPDLTVSSPADGATIYGDKNKQITIDAKTEGGISVQINGRNAQVADDGSVKGSMTLAEGENTIEIKAVDKAGNEKVVSLLVTFKP